MNKYRVGDVIFWTLNEKMECKGVVCKDGGGDSLEVVLHKINDKTYFRKVIVPRDIIYTDSNNNL
jgi:uncharacterized protein YijF (DUF1287 family)